jgi:hypothetical protein
MVLFNILGSKETLLSPEIAISGMLIPLYEEQCRGSNAFGVNEIPGRSDRFFIPALDTILGDSL